MNFGDNQHFIQLIFKTKSLIRTICCNTTQSGQDVTRKVIFYCVNQLISKYTVRGPFKIKVNLGRSYWYWGRGTVLVSSYN